MQVLCYTIKFSNQYILLYCYKFHRQVPRGPDDALILRMQYLWWPQCEMFVKEICRIPIYRYNFDKIILLISMMELFLVELISIQLQNKMSQSKFTLLRNNEGFHLVQILASYFVWTVCYQTDLLSSYCFTCFNQSHKY